MDERWRIYVVALVVVVCTTSVRAFKFSIDTTWNGSTIDHTPVKLSLSASPDKEYLQLDVSAPFFDDPASPPGAPGQPFLGLWEYEVVEAFFLNDADQYLEVEICPWGQHIVLLLNGQRVTVRHSLQLKVTTLRDGITWSGSAAIPISYLPEKVTKFNAYAIHGTGADRVYESLYPAPTTALNPDFHALQYFQPIDLSSLLPTQASDAMSQLWSDAIQGLFRYDIATTWDGRPLSSPPVQITLQGFEAGVEMNVTAPFYNDPAPSGPAGQPFYSLWDYEVVEMFFLNKNDEYLEVELGPLGQHLLLLLQGERNAIKHSMPLDYIITARTDPVGNTPGQWKGSAMIPPGYFPPNVTLMNAYAIHGVDEARQYQAHYPAPRNDPNYPQPDFHRLDLFRAIDFEFQVKDNKDYSQVWQDAMGSGASTVSGASSLLLVAAVVVAAMLVVVPIADVVTTTLETLRSDDTSPPEPADPTTPEPVDPTTQQPMGSDTAEPKESAAPVTNLPEATNTENPEPTNTFTPKPTNTVTPEPTETLPVDSTDTVDTETTKEASEDPTTLPPTTPAPTTLPEPLEASTPTQSPGNTRTAVRRRPHPQRVDTNQQSVNFASPNLPVRPRRRPVPNPLRVRPNRRVVNQKQGFPFDINLLPANPFIQHILSQENLGFKTPRGQAHQRQQNHRQQFSPRDQQFQPPHGQQFQPPRNQQFQPPRDQQFEPPVDQQFQPPRNQQFQPPRDQEFQPPRDQEFQPPRDQEFQPPRDQEFQPPRDQEFKPPRDQEFQPPRDQQFQPPRDQQLSVPQEEQQEQTRPRPSSAGEQQLPPSREGDAPLGVAEEDAGLLEVEEVLTSLTEGASALPPPHPICFSPGLVPDENRCWVFHECELENGQWQVYSWKCVRGHVFDAFSVACVPGRCRRRG